MKITNEVMKNNYLQYLEVYLNNADENGALFRTFIDSWYAYYKGGPLLNRNGNVVWLNRPDPIKLKDTLIHAGDFISTKAMRIMNGEEPGRLVKDHSIPIKILRKLIVREQRVNTAYIEEFLKDHYRLGIITKDEDRKINAEKLRSNMPEDWDEKDPFARYRAVNIEEATSKITPPSF
jgi:hypothetical protein